VTLYGESESRNCHKNLLVLKTLIFIFLVEVKNPFFFFCFFSSHLKHKIQGHNFYTGEALFKSALKSDALFEWTQNKKVLRLPSWYSQSTPETAAKMKLRIVTKRYFLQYQSTFTLTVTM
jgi:hypothetical protein